MQDASVPPLNTGRLRLLDFRMGGDRLQFGFGARLAPQYVRIQTPLCTRLASALSVAAAVWHP